METPKTHEVIKRQDIRQSKEWAEYLKKFGWFSERTLSGINIEFIKSPLGTFSKVQRPGKLTGEDLEHLLKVALKNKAAFVKIEPSFLQDKLYEANGYEISMNPLSPPSTIYMNLKNPEDELFNDISKSGRYSIRRAKKEGAYTEIYEAPSDDILKLEAEVFKETSSSQHFTPPSFEDLRLKTSVFGNKSFAVLGFDKEKKLAGAKYFLVNENCVWYLHAGTTEHGRKMDIGHLMMWESFLYFKNRGYDLMDLDGIDDDRFPSFTKKWGGFSFFKEKFGGEVVRFPYPRILYINKLLRMLSHFTKASL